MNIKWKSVPEYDGYYEVSNFGDIKRIVTYNGKPINRILKPQDNGKGYMRVRLYKNGESKFFRVHRIVMQAFVGKCPNGEEINHKDGNKANNALSNLEYMTKSENNLHMYRKLGRQRRHDNYKRLSQDEVVQIRQLYATNQYSQLELGNMFGVNRNTIGNAVRRITWKHI